MDCSVMTANTLMITALWRLLALDCDYLDQIHKKDSLHNVMDLIKGMDDDDKKLVSALLLDDRNEKELAETYQVSQQEINRKKKKILKRLRESLKAGAKKLKALLFV